MITILSILLVPVEVNSTLFIWTADNFVTTFFTTSKVNEKGINN